MSADVERGPARESDRHAIQLFECTEKPRHVELSDGHWVKVHDREYELLVQRKVRCFRPPLGPPHYMIVVRDVTGLAGVIIFEELDGPGEVELHFIAVALRCRRPGGSGIGGILMRDALDSITTRAVEEQVNEVFVSTLIHPDNEASSKLCAHFGLRRNRQRDEEGMHYWSLSLFIALDENEQI